MTTWWAMPTSQQETCWTTSLRPTATSLQSTWRSTSSTCAEPGIPSIQWRLSSSRFKTAITIRRQVASPSVPHSRSTLGMQTYLHDKTWTHFKSHFAAAHRQHKQMKGETAANAGYHSANAAMTQNEYQMAEATIGALANLATANAADRGMVTALTQANSRLVKQLEENASKLKELKALLNQERRDRRGPRISNSSASNYCWTHGYKC
jgi:hypothetical protein